MVKPLADNTGVFPININGTLTTRAAEIYIKRSIATPSSFHPQLRSIRLNAYSSRPGLHLHIHLHCASAVPQYKRVPALTTATDCPIISIEARTRAGE